MGNRYTRRSARRHKSRERLPARTSVGAAVFFALYGMPQLGCAQQTDTSSSELNEITVTATRRVQALEAIPYNISVVSGDEISRTGVTDLASLANEVPGLSLYDFGARQSGATVPVIRGINASDTSVEGRSFRTFEQSPVGLYIGNSPVDGYFQLDDVQRVEVLRGPQGTLYGAGAIGGALRIIPNSPELGVFSGRIEASGGSLEHSSGKAYGSSVMLNVPIGDTLAFRASGKFAYQPGFIDVYGILKRTGSPLYGDPLLANPGDPVNSPGIFYTKKNWNDQNTFTGRASLLWKPSEKFKAELGFIYANVNGDGGPFVNPTYQGGAYPLDPRMTFPHGSNYLTFSAVDQQYWRRTTLSSVDLSYDAGFATLSSTSSYATTTGFSMGDATYPLGTAPAFNNYYAGNPINPRYVSPALFTDAAHTFDQEVRLVSTAGPDKLFDYVVGLFYANQVRNGTWYSPSPGSAERAIAQGCTGPYYAGATYPNCLLSVGPNDSNFDQADVQNFTDKSVFGELTWHFINHGQITFGGRYFKQEFTDTQSYLVYTFGTLLPAVPHSSPASKNTWKINPSYEYSQDQYVYAIWSQGFRRGGANSVPSVGVYRESPVLSQYAPDSVNNYEVGVKGRFENNLSYTVSLFDIRWDKPQISSTLPDGNLAVYNANTAESKGVEFELRGPLIIRGLSYSVGGSYTDAKLASSFSLPANNGDGTGTIVPGLISGASGEQLPGSPKTSVAATITYDHSVAPDYDLTISLNGTYRSMVPLFLSPQYLQYHSGAFGLANFSAGVTHRPWYLGLYAKNLLDRRVVLYPFVPISYTTAGHLIDNQNINMPREVGLRMSYTF